MNDQRPAWLRRVLWFYSGWFRYGGLIIGILSGAMFLVTLLAIIRDGHVLVGGMPSNSVEHLVTALGIPLLGTAVGLAIFLFVPRAQLPKK